MSRSMGARRRNSKPSSRVRRISIKERSPKTGKIVNRLEKQQLVPFWVSSEVMQAPIGALGLPTGPNRMSPGRTAVKVVDHLGKPGYCHPSQYASIMADVAKRRAAMLEEGSES